MGRANKIKFVRVIYEIDSGIEDVFVARAIRAVFGGSLTSRETLHTWKSKLRRQGVEILDGRKRQC